MTTNPKFTEAQSYAFVSLHISLFVEIMEDMKKCEQGELLAKLVNATQET